MDGGEKRGERQYITSEVGDKHPRLIYQYIASNKLCKHINGEILYSHSYTVTWFSWFAVYFKN